MCVLSIKVATYEKSLETYLMILMVKWFQVLLLNNSNSISVYEEFQI